jgi:hypothetical protein
MKHGHVTPNADGSLARCGGPGICAVCAKELQQLEAAKVAAEPKVDPITPYDLFLCAALIGRLASPHCGPQDLQSWVLKGDADELMKIRRKS